MDNEWYTEADPGRWHLMKERMTVTVVFILFVVVFCMVALRLYVRWYVLSQLERRAMFGNVVFYGEDNQPGTTADRGLEPEVLDSLPVFHYSVFKKTEQSTQECSVCLSEFEENDVVRLLPQCNHSFHVDCIDMWLHAHSTCPICRSKVEAVVKPVSTGGEMVVEVCRSEPGSSSGVRPGNESEIANTMSLHGDGLVGPSTEVSPPIQDQLDCELTQTRLTSFKELLEKSPIDAPLGNSRGPTELDLESGPTEIRRTSE